MPLVQGPDAHAGGIGNGIRSESPPTLTVENASPGLQYCFDGCAGALLVRLFSHLSARGQCASSQKCTSAKI